MFQLILISLSILLISCQDIKQNVISLTGGSVESITTADGYKEAYLIKIKQPLDHEHPDKGSFTQRIYLSHIDFSKPMVIVTAGYNSDQNIISEVSSLLNANQLIVEHRYFGESLPDSIDYQYLTLEQATADLHRINQLFKQLYAGKWVSTGISKGGQLSIFYRYFYPDDVDASVPYVAPLNRAYEDTRVYDFLNTAGSDECRASILDFQKRLLTKRHEVLPLLKKQTDKDNQSFDYLGFEAAFEYAVLEMPFSFWQWGGKCEEIPGATAAVETDLNYLLAVSGIGLFSDRLIEFYGSHYYQSATQIGYYGYETEPFKDLLKALPLKPHPHAAFVPNKLKVDFNDELLQKVNTWITENGNQFAYIYGANDPWTANSVKPTDEVDAIWIIMDGKHHGTARIAHMTDSERYSLKMKLEEWLGIKIE